MQDFILEEKIQLEIEKIIEGLGFKLVDVRVGLGKRLTKVSVVIYRRDDEGGVTLENCEKISRTIAPRLELFDELENMTLEVTSPGLSRVLRSNREFDIFKGRGIKLILNNGKIVSGILSDYLRDEDKLKINIGDNFVEIATSEIRKARLSEIQEVK